MNNFEKIKQMSLAEMTCWIVSNLHSDCQFCPHVDKFIEDCDRYDCKEEQTKGVKEYLLQEVEE